MRNAIVARNCRPSVDLRFFHRLCGAKKRLAALNWLGNLHVRRLRLPRILFWPFVAAAIAIVAFTVVCTSSREVVVYPSEQIVVGGCTRTFRVVNPRTDTSEQLPIVFMFHGHGNTPESEADRTKLDQLAASQGFLLVYPAAIQGNWSIHTFEPGSSDDNRDIRFFDALLEHLTARFHVDRTRVYLVGMSMGATFVHQLALARSGTVAAAVAHSGSAPSPKECERPFPLMIVVGANESPVALDSARVDACEYRHGGHICELLVVKGIGHEWAQGQNLQMWRFLARHRLDDCSFPRK